MSNSQRDAICLQQFLVNSVAQHPDRTAVEDCQGRSLTYRELDQLTDRVRDRIRAMGIAPNDRVGFYYKKSINALASMYGILKAGCCYVPVDPDAPASRNAYIFNHCGVKAVFVQDLFAEKLSTEMEALGDVPPMISVGRPDGEIGLAAALDALDADSTAPATETVDSDPQDLAYILYTSGSTGKPKGVMLTHENGVSFVDWCSEVFEPEPTDRFSSHAPFHFDLSILDVHVSMKHGATLVIIGEDEGKDPHGLAMLIAEKKITSWYSAPSILGLLAQYGKLPNYDYSSLTRILFAGEVFPVKHLRALKELLPEPRYYNLYGPTETNVCTWYEIPSEIPEDRTQPFPIGLTCSHLEDLVIDVDGSVVEKGKEGELCMRGPGVTQGYYNLPEQNANAFHVDPDGGKWYKTGDIVIEAEDGNYTFLGRRDRMVKKRGYRIELGEIEAGLITHDDVEEVGVLSTTNDDGDVKIFAFIGTKTGEPLSIIAMKGFSSKVLPAYMIPDRFIYKEKLPRTSTGKVDYQTLKKES